MRPCLRRARRPWQEGVSHRASWFRRSAAEPIVKVMFAVYAARIDRDQPLSGLELGERPAPEVRPGWSAVNVKAASSTITTSGHCGAWACPRTGCR